jgi:hypothetical protein
MYCLEEGILKMLHRSPVRRAHVMAVRPSMDGLCVVHPLWPMVMARDQVEVDHPLTTSSLTINTLWCKRIFD